LNVLVTGADGFVGQHLVPHFARQGAMVVGAVIRGNMATMPTEYFQFATYFEWDLTRFDEVRQWVAKVRPDIVVHLAAQSSVGASFEGPLGTFQINLNGTLHLLEAVRQLSMKPVILLIASAEVYGEVEETHQPILEDEPLCPLNPYGVSKAAADLLGYQYWKSFGLPIVRLRSFNHIGPGQSPQFVISSWAKQVAEIEKGLRPATLTVGDISVSRDFLDVQDVVEAYRLATIKARPGEAYNICSGTPIQPASILGKLQSLARVPFQIEQSAELMRKSDAKLVFGDPSKFRVDTGWLPKIDFDSSLERVLDWWRERV
jgi:GDP-4-dehydro-6-deoxy-D-mannose reductase